jgi:hypothetical protein
MLSHVPATLKAGHIAKVLARVALRMPGSKFIYTFDESLNPSVISVVGQGRVFAWINVCDIESVLEEIRHQERTDEERGSSDRAQANAVHRTDRDSG